MTIKDTTNEEKLGKFTRNYYLDAHGAIIVFDLTNEKSFNKVKFWLDELNSNAPKNIIYCTLGNKVDLKGDRKIDYYDAVELREKGNLYYEVSALTGEDVSLAFESLIEEIEYKQKKEENNPDKVIRGIEGRKATNLKKFKKKKKKICKCDKIIILAIIKNYNK